MQYLKFLSLSAIGSLVWVSALAFIGKSVGSKWPQWKHHLDIVDYIAAVVIVGLIAWWLWKVIQNRRATPAV
jgi:membrane protein DedA with SNARE-associated domain